ncbi:MAG: hypothetical protein KAQ91_10425 [Methylococcales bacterium]|nr:hypothetical protein [Methylococcales bacterium]
MKLERRMKFILFTMVFALVADLCAWYLHTGWIGAAIITLLLNLMLLFYIIKYRDSLLARLYLFALIVGFGELPTDYLAVAIQQTLVYAADEPFIWKSPFYMPFSWAAVLTQLGYLAWWMIQKWGLGTATLLTGILGAINLPTYEFIAKQAGFWYYQNAWMIFFDSTPVYVIVGEFLLTLSIPLIIQQVQKCKLSWIVFWSGIESILIFLSTITAYHFFS